MTHFIEGRDYTRKGRVVPTFGIDYGAHGNLIEVYGDEALRDKIIELLNKPNEEE